MWYEELFKTIESMKDTVAAEKMSAYMQNQVPFIGVSKKMLDEIVKPFWKMVPKTEFIDWNFVHYCWEKDYREAQYVGIAYLKRNKKKLQEEDFEPLKQLILTKSWWDTVDNLDVFIGILALKYEKVKQAMLEWSVSDELWLKRVAINYQQEYKEQTDEAQLEKIIVNNLGTNEFFINKAIGWSLRDYSKTNPEWVRSFTEKYRDKLSKLSMKEATKYLP